MKKYMQTHAIALGAGIILGAAFKGLMIIGLVILVAGASVYGYLQMKKSGDI